MTRCGLLTGLVLALAANAQLIPAGSPVPRTTLPPVVFINGYQFEGCPSSFDGTFGIADQVLQTNGEVSLFFSTCSLPSTASIEDLGAAFATFLSGLTYPDGKPVEQVDVVAHSMGGLVLRCYLSGKQNASGAFQPPAGPHIRKSVFLATPHFGTGIASFFGGLTTQVKELSSGSAFLFDLDTWNQGTDDLRGVDAVAAAGNVGNGGSGNPAGFDDGVVALTSASLRFYLPGRTRVVPYCHITSGGIVSIVCPSDAKGIAKIDSPTHSSAQIIVSFLSGTNDWQSVGTAAEDNTFLKANGGLLAAARAADDSSLHIDSAIAGQPGPGFAKPLNISGDNLAFTDQFPSGPLTINVKSGSLNINSSITLPAGGTEPYTVKPGPLITRILPAAANIFPLSLAPGMLISIYGSAMADAEVLLGAEPIFLVYRSATQINAVLPDPLSGLFALTVQNTTGRHTVNIYVGTAAPAIFTLDSSGTGPAAALKAPELTVVTADNPLHAGDAVALYLTGLGHNGLDAPFIQPTVTVGNKDCPVTFAGRAPFFIGLDQINCTIPSGIAATSSAPVVVTAGGHISNTATLAIQ